MKKPTKSIIASSLLAVAFGALSVGSTFALFTSQSKTEVTVGSGIVNVESKATLVNYSSAVDGTDHDFEGTETSYSNDKVGNSFSINGDNSIVTIDKMVPGDSLTINLSALNKSNVKTKTRLVINHATIGTKTDLFPALKLTFNAGELQPTDLFRWQENNAVTDIATGANLYGENGILVTIKLPDNDNGAILFDNENHDNQYQDAACSIAFSLQAVQGNAATSPIDEINAYLTAEKIVEGQNKTMYEAVQDMAELNYGIDILNYNNVKYVFDLVNDQFVKEESVTANKVNYFRVYESMPTTQDFSIYAVGNDWTSAINNLTVGFDAGETTSIPSIVYDRHEVQSTEGQAVVIRTNGGNLSINAPYDTVKHYGEIDNLDIIAVAGHSYYENGMVIVARIATGRIVLTEEAEVSGIYLVANAQDKFDDIKLAVVGDAILPALSRADVTVDQEPVLVLEVQQLASEEDTVSNSEFVWLTPAGETQVTSDEEGQQIVEASEIVQAVEEEIEEAKSLYAITTLEELKTFIGLANSGTVANPIGLVAPVEIQFDAELELRRTMTLKGSLGTVFKGFNVTDDYCEAFFVNTYSFNQTITIENIEFDHFGYYKDVEEETLDTKGITSYLTYSMNCASTTALNIIGCDFIGTGRDMINASSTGGCAGTINIEDCTFDAGDRISSSLNMISLFGKSDSVLDVTITNCIFSEADEENDKWASTAIASFGNCDLAVDGCTFITCQVAIAADNIFYELNNISAQEVTHNTDAVITDVTYIDCYFGYFFEGFVNSVEGIECEYDADYTIAGREISEYDYVESGEYGVTAKYLVTKCYYLLKN